jgi:hypothetical protein
MRTRVEIPDGELEDLLEFTKAKTRREAIVTAITAFNRRHRMAALVKVKYSGTFRSLMTNDQIEALAVRERIRGRS